MTKQITNLIGIVLLLAAASASAQSADEIRATVPFPFVMAGKSLPAADYRVHVNRENGTLTLSSPGISSVTMLSNTGQRAQEDDHSCLRFRRSGDRWVLQEVRLYGTAQVLLDKFDRDPINLEPSSHEPIVISIPDSR